MQIGRSGVIVVAVAFGLAFAGCRARARARSARVDHLADIPDLRGTSSTVGLRAILEAYGISVSPEALDRQCHVQDDGASIDDLEEAARRHGLAAEQILVPAEHVLIASSQALPCLIVTVDDQANHQFVALWRMEHGRVQILDPSAGRRWSEGGALIKRAYLHEMAIPTPQWEQYAAEPGFQDPLRDRMRSLGVPDGLVEELMTAGSAEDAGRRLAALDATVRSLERGSGTSGELRALFACAYQGACSGLSPPEPSAWTARVGATGPDGLPQTIVRGALLVRMTGRL